jgi:fatty-acid desaturase
MLMNIKQQQTIKFFLLCFFSIFGIAFYIVDNGTLLKAFYIYLGFWIISRIHMIAHHKWLGHNEIKPNTFLRIFFLYVLITCNLVKPVHYVLCHRLHHRYSDSDKDPHANSIGFWNLLIGNLKIPDRPYIFMKDIYRQKDIMFVNKYFYHLYIINLIFIWIIDPHIVMLIFSLLNLKILINATIFNYIAHGGMKIQSPVNLPRYVKLIFGYWGESDHKNHHDKYDFYYKRNINI